MTDLATLDPHGTLGDDATLTIRRLLPGPAERVWSYLVDGDKRRRWLADGAMPGEPGVPFTLTWRNVTLTTPPGRRPDGFGAEHSMESRITELDPPHRLSFTWDGTGDVTFLLEPQGAQVLLTVIHRRLPSRRMMLNVSAGWHAHLDLLAARIDGGETPPFWDAWASLKDDYERRLPA